MTAELGLFKVVSCICSSYDDMNIKLVRCDRLGSIYDCEVSAW